MKLEELLLKKEEIPILNGNLFMVPIHPALLREDIQIHPNLAYEFFERAADEWYEELKERMEGTEDVRERTWYRDYFLKDKPKIVKDRHGRMRLEPVTAWEALVQTQDNGFAVVLSISRNAGGTLYLPPDHEPDRIIGPRYVRFPREKLEAYSIHKDIELTSSGCTHAHVYGHHNVDHFPGALFLRNWALLYLNAAMTEVGEEKLNVA